MDADQEQSNPLQREQAGSFSWIAALLVGGILILMLLVIFTIVIWKCIKKPNTADNWAGPSPLAARELHENNSFDMNEFPIATNDLSFKTTSPITLMGGQPHISPKDYGLSNDVSQRDEGNIKPLQIIGVKAEISIPPPTAGEKEHTPVDTTSIVQPSTEINVTVLPEEPILAPPPDSFQDSSMSQWDEALARSDFEENQLPPPPLSWSVIDYHNDTGSQNTLNAQTILKCEKDTSFNTDYQLLPPPPPELL